MKLPPPTSERFMPRISLQSEHSQRFQTFHKLGNVGVKVDGFGGRGSELVSVFPERRGPDVVEKLADAEHGWLELGTVVCWRVCITVEDEWAGRHEEMSENIFDHFHRKSEHYGRGGILFIQQIAISYSLF